MKRIDWKVFVLLGIIISISAGFLYGTGILGGDADSPGSSEDPLVSQSYADGTINRRLQELDAKVVTLEAKVKSLEDEITILTGGTADPGASVGAGTGGGGTAGTGATGGGTAGTGATGGGATGNTGANTASAANIGKSATVTTNAVNLRESGSTSSNIKGRLTPNDTFTITKVDNGWYQVQLPDGTVGWVAGYLVEIK